jgi:hypothetical protein
MPRNHLGGEFDRLAVELAQMWGGPEGTLPKA